MTQNNPYNIQTKTYKNLLQEEQDSIAWLNDKRCVGYKRDVAYRTLQRVRDRKQAYECVVLRGRERW